MSELQVTPERSLRGGPRAARRAVAQLIRLGKSAQVCIYSYFYLYKSKCVLVPMLLSNTNENFREVYLWE